MTVLDAHVAVPAPTVDRRSLLAATGAAAVAFDLAVHSPVVCVAGTLLVMVLACGLAADGRLRNRQAQAMAALAVVFGAFLSLRASEWLAALDILAVVGLLACAASFAPGGSVLDVRGRDVFGRAVHAVGAGFGGLVLLARAVPRGLAVGPVVRGLALAVPVVIVLGSLLASGDAVFARLFRVPLDLSWTDHLLLLAVGAWAMAALVATAASAPTSPVVAARSRLGITEATILLGALVALYGAFAVVQVVAVAKGDAWVQERAGLTYAEYARSGFFQLLGVAALTLLVLAVVRSCTAPDRRLTGLALVAIGLTLAIVAVAVRRLHLYEDAFGLTVLRLVAVTFAVWVGAVFVLLAASWAGVGKDRSWLPGAAVGVGLALLLALNVVDAEALVVRRNLSRPDFDAAYAAGLSDDAVPALLSHPEGRRLACYPSYATDPPEDEGWSAWNRSVRRADAARRAACPSGFRVQ